MSEQKKKERYDFYVAGPIRGVPDFNKPMFYLVTRLLKEKGFTAWCPNIDPELSFAQLISNDLDMVINHCSGIAFLPGWRESQGANVEAFVSFLCGKKTVEVVLNNNKTEIELKPIDLREYKLPYSKEEISPFDPHRCEIDSFQETSK